jgi:predicted RNA-binding Zn-ribbon protein involved in translation (DUF1610 family)
MTTVRDSAGRRRRNVDGYRCVSCGQWAPAEHWDETVCPRCHEMHAELPKVERRWLHVVNAEPKQLDPATALRGLGQGTRGEGER